MGNIGKNWRPEEGGLNEIPDEDEEEEEEEEEEEDDEEDPGQKTQ